MILPPYINVNRGGIPALKSTSVSVTTAQVAFDFNNHRNVGWPFRGLMVLNLAQTIPAATATTLPIVLTTNGGTPKPLTTFGGDAITVADIPGTGVYLAWYEADTDTLQLLTGTIA